MFTEELIDSVIAVLKGGDGSAHTGGLPANWWEDGNDGLEVVLKLLEHGDVADYPGADALEEDTPAILVRGLGPTPTGLAATGGVQETEEIIRIVHVRAAEHCRDASGNRELNMTRARARYAKLINLALWNDPHRKLAVIDAEGARTEVSLSCEDGAGAQLYDVGWNGWDLGADIGNPNSMEDVRMLRQLPARVWAIACELAVRIRSGGAA